MDSQRESDGKVNRTNNRKNRKITNQSPLEESVKNGQKAFQLKWSSFHRQSKWKRQQKKKLSQQQKLTAFVDRNHFIIQCLFCVNAYSSHSAFVSVLFAFLVPTYFDFGTLFFLEHSVSRAFFYYEWND